MQTAAVSELKASVSEYLARVKAGEEILVTDRGKPIAKIVPLSRTEDAVSARMALLERSGLARVGKGGLPEAFWSIQRPRDPQGRALASLLMEREDER